MSAQGIFTYKDIYNGHVMLLIAIAFASIMASFSISPTDFSTAVLIRVDQSGNGDYRRIQDAINAVPSRNSEQVFISVKPGTYRERIVVPADKPYIILSGTQASNTIITWNGIGEHLYDSPALSVLASDFVAQELTIQNTWGTTIQAVALRVSGDRAAFYGCRIISYQDTLWDDTGRHYFKNCYIQGATDFICGDATSLYEACHLHSISGGEGAVTAHRRLSPSDSTCFSFLGCKITGKVIGAATLGRPWGAYARVIFAHTYMSNVISPQGWDDWGNPNNHGTITYGEYKCYGPGANRIRRVKWSRSLSDAEVAPFLSTDMIGGRSWIRPSPTRFKRWSK